MASSSLDPSYNSHDLYLLQERSKLALALEQLEAAMVESKRDPPNPLEQYQFLLRVLHLKPCNEYLTLLTSYFSANVEEKKNEELDFSRTFVGEKHWLLIILTLSGCTYLQRINLSKQRLSSVLIQMLCEALAQLPNLFSIDVSYNPCGSSAVKFLLRLAKRNKKIVFCKISGINCTSALTRRLEEVIMSNRAPFLEEAKQIKEKIEVSRSLVEDDAPPKETTVE